MDTIRINTERYLLFAPCIHVAVGATVDICLNIHQVKQALVQLCRRHPLLTAAILIDEQNKAQYVLDAGNEIIPIIKECSGIVPFDNIQALLSETDNQPFDLEHGPLLRVLLLRGESVTNILFLGHHILGDGLSFCYLMRDFLAALDGVMDRKTLIPPVIGDTSHFPKHMRQSLRSMMFAQSCNKRYCNSEKRYTLADCYANHERVRALREPAMLFHFFNEAETAAVVVNCKTHGVTVNEGIAAAFWAARHEKGGFSNIVGIAVDVRGDLIPHPGESIGNFVSGIRVRADYDEAIGFWENARALKTLTNASLKDPKIRIEALTFYNALCDGLCDAINFPISHPVVKQLEPYLLGESFKGLGVSNLGKHNFLYQSFSVSDAWFAPPLFVTGDMIAGIITANNKMTICMRYGVKETGHNGAEKILEQTRLLLLGRTAK